MGDSKSADAAKTAAVLTSQLLANPNVLAAFTQELDSMVGKSSGYIESLPDSVQRRIKALKKLQGELFEIESQFYTDIHNLECKYSQLYAPVLNKRRDIISGTLEPTDADCDWDREHDEKQKDEHNEPAASGDRKQTAQDPETNDLSEADKHTLTEESEDTRGIPEFWLTIFKNVEELSALVQEQDEPVLRSLQDVRVKYLPDDNMGFKIEFVFAPNDYFSNATLTKEYQLRCKPDEQQPLCYEGPEIIKCSGCVIDWKPGKNVTERSVKQKTKSRNKKIVKKSVKVDSFFNFFSPPKSCEDSVQSEEVEEQLMADYEIGRLLQERIVPRAVLYFTGEALDDDDEDGEDEGEDDDNAEGEGSEDEANDPDYEPPAGAGDGPPDCRQQ
jgi:nucleosome assembly protein 1-like 1